MQSMLYIHSLDLEARENRKDEEAGELKEE